MSAHPVQNTANSGLTSAETFDREFLPARAKLLELAATLDRIDRAGGAEGDPRLSKIHEALQTLLETNTADRAEQLQQIFSLTYDDAWRSNFDLPGS